MLDYRYYTFLTLSKTLNYTKAASLLCITQPAVSQHIKYLETQYNCKLLDHTGKDLQLTQQGKRLQECIATMVADEQHVKQLMEMKPQHQNSLRFGATLTIGEFILPQQLSSYMKQHKDTHLTMIVENTSTLIKQLQEGKLQFAFVEGYFKKSDVYHELLSKQRYIAIKHKDYILQKPITKLEDLLEETLIVREGGSGTREVLERMLQEHNLTIDDFANTIEIGNINAITHMVEAHMGITFLYEAAVQAKLQQGTFEIIPLQDFPIERDFSFITLKNSMYLQDYLDFLKQMKPKEEHV